MSADVETMIAIGKVPWLGLGKIYDEGTILTKEQVLAEADLDWTVEVAPIVTADHIRTAVDDYRVTRRIRDERILGIVKTGWAPIQNKDAFTVFDNIITKGKARYETAGSLQGGSKVFALAKLGEPLLLAGGRDVVDRYFLLSNAHDGSRPLQMLFTPVRVVCSNTLNMALHKSSEDDITRTAPKVTIAHNLRNVKFMMKEAERAMAKALQYYELFGEFSEHLTRQQVSSDVVETVIETVFPDNKKGEITPTISEHRDHVEGLFTDGAGHDVDGVRGTAWALLNAFAQYADHGYAVRSKKVKTAQERAYSVWMGGAKGMKERANSVISKVFT